ncbi:heavy metal translocating P-type ATPase [Solirubrobacter soli]|uniref:heavy metal translocating P-type ATPase n=1 Tax=Solirubrobacter soli TaxID=363832 RepID=UPI00040C9CA4|nr:heavy metal translocating P-type ATPase [Solirubrobacter soli]
MTGSRLIAALALASIAIGAALALAGADAAANAVWSVAVAIALLALGASVVRGLARGHVGVDVIALLAMAGALALGEALAGAVIALMLAGGNALEEEAGKRARRDLTALLDHAPRVAHRREGGQLVEVSVDTLAPGDIVIVRAGEVVPVDGAVVEGAALLDESALTGEALPVSRTTARAGTVCAGQAFTLRCERTAADSAYSALVRLVENAHAARAPFVRLADRYAVAFLPLTLILAAGAWAVSGDPVRGLAVLVVATPCPLILAAPIAIVSGMSRTARVGVVVKDGGAIERLAQARTVLIDKTGTLTLGEPEVAEVLGGDEVLRLAASVEQLSTHGVAEAVVHAAERRGLVLELPQDVTERPGQGVEGQVDGHRVTVGSAAWLAERGIAVDATQAVHVGVDGRPVGAVLVADRLRDDARAAVEALRASGVRRVIMATGDRRDIAEAVGRQAGVDEVHAELGPEDKLALVRDTRERPVIMVGDGINDAPALALADVGVAMGVAGATAAAEAADAVIVVDRLDRLAAAVRISGRALRIARQSVLGGMALSLVAMGFAAAGALPPLAGALLQEVIDVAAILNALRALKA